MAILIATLSILILTGVVYVFDKISGWSVCPICAGVSLSWLWMIIAMAYGFLPVAQYEFIIAILMGASIGGIVNEIKKAFAKWRTKQTEPNKLLEDKLKNCC